MAGLAFGEHSVPSLFILTEAQVMGLKGLGLPCIRMATIIVSKFLIIINEVILAWGRNLLHVVQRLPFDAFPASQARAPARAGASSSTAKPAMGNHGRPS